MIDGRVVEVDFKRLFVALPSVMLETSGFVVFESFLILGTELCYLGRLSGCIIIFYMSFEAIAAIFDDLTGTFGLELGLLT